MRNNWPTKKLGEVANINYGTRIVKARNDSGKYFVYGGGGKTFTTDSFNRKNCVILSRFAMSSNCVRRIEERFYLNDSGLTLSAKNINELNNKYLEWWLFFSENKIYNLGRGQAQKNLDIKSFLTLEIPLPTIGEQRRIVKRIEKLFAKIDEAQKLREESKKSASVLLQSALNEILSSPKSKKWEKKEIKEICEHPQYGFTASSSQEPIGPKFLRITDIQDGKVNWDAVPYCKCSIIERYRLSKGDIVFARTGATVGKSFLITNVPKNAIFASYLIRLRVKDKVLPEFLYYFFQSSNYWREITEGQVGMAQPNVNGSKLAKIKIPLPPIKEQKKIVTYLDSFSEKVQKLQDLQQKTADDFKNLKKSILPKAFKGELI